MKVVILDGYSVTQEDLNWQAQESLPDVEVIVYPRTDAKDTVARCKDAEAVLTNKVIISAETMSALPSLRYIGVLATGYNVVDLKEALGRGIVVTNIPAYSTNSVAQLVFAHLLNVTNSVAHYAEARQRWAESKDFMWMDTSLRELSGKIFAIYGLGNIGRTVAHIAHAFGMKVVAVTRQEADALPEGVEKVTWETALREADILSLHCPLTPETRGMINTETLQWMKPTAILINTGRGPLVQEQAVAEALSSNRLAAYCADVLSTEPPTADNPLLTAPHCYLTPHIAWATKEARSRLIQIATANLHAFIEGRPQNVING